MKRIISVVIIGAFVLSGCSDSANNIDSPMPETDTTMNQDIQLVSFQPENQKGSIDLMTEENGTVYWNHKEIKNLNRLDKFLENVSNNVKDQITIQTHAKDQVVEIDHEGKIVEPPDNTRIVTDLSYDGEQLLVTTNDGETKEFEKIFVKERYNEHYNGTFVEYMVEDAEGKQMLVLQIGPDLAEKLK